MLTIDQCQFGKKLYDDTATVIMDLFMTGRIDTAELHCLLNLLEAVMITREHRGLIDLLKRWRPGIEHTEADDIIKGTLLALNFDDRADMDHSLAILSELISLGE